VHISSFSACSSHWEERHTSSSVRHPPSGWLHCWTSAAGKRPNCSRGTSSRARRPRLIPTSTALWPTDHELRRRAAIEIVNLGRQLDERGDAEAALARYREVVALAPEIPHGHHALVASLRARGEVDEAIAALKTGLGHGPNDGQLRLQLAWMLATHPDPAQRDADRAIALANDAFMHDRTPETLETMAVALAAGGDFAGAVRHELDAIELAGGEDAPEFEARRARLESFKARQPYVEGPRSQR
jgi:tetratricopeptide (TPR) repeat protein